MATDGRYPARPACRRGCPAGARPSALMGVLHHAAERAAGVEGRARRHALVEVATPAGHWPAWEFFITPGGGSRRIAAGSVGVLHHARHGEEGQALESSSSHGAPPRRDPPHALRVLHHAVRFAPLAARSGRPGGWFAGAVHHDSAHRPLRVLHHAVQPVPMTWPPRRWPSGGSSSSPGELLQQLARWTVAAVGGSSSSRRRPRRRAWKKRPRQSAYNARKQPRDGRGLGLGVKIAPGASQAAMWPFPSALARPPACKTRFLAIQAARSYQSPARTRAR